MTSLFPGPDTISIIADIETGSGLTQIQTSEGSQISLMDWDAAGATTAESGSGSVTASYSGADLGGAPNFGMMTFSLTSGAADSGCAVIVANPNGLSQVADITDNSLHLAFTDTKVDVAYFNAGSLTIVSSISYIRPLTKDGATKYRGGFAISGNDLTVYLPDGLTQVVSNAGFAANNGRYCQFESFTSSSGGIRATFYSATFRRAA